MFLQVVSLLNFLQKWLKADAVPSVLVWTSGTNLVQLARQCRARRRAKAVRNVVPKRSSHTAVDVNQVVEVSESPVVDVIATFEASFDAEPANVSIDCSAQTDISVRVYRMFQEPHRRNILISYLV